MKPRSLYITMMLIALCASPLAAQAQRIGPAPRAVATSGINEGIVAVVNDNVISSADLNARMAMAFLSSGLPDTPEVRERLVMQVLRTMIDEQLELQEAKKVDVTVPSQDIDKALEHIAHDNNIPGGDMKAFLSAHGIPPDALINQIRASMAWNKVIQRELRPRVEIGDDEIDAVIERGRADAGKEEFLVSEIFLSVDNPKDEEQVKQFADNLVQQIKAGTNFGAVARQFSQNSSAAAGGDIGWIREGQLAPEINHELTSMQSGSVAGPIRSASGYHIIGLREKRTVTVGGDTDSKVGMQQAFRPFNKGENKDALLKETEQLRTSINDCNNLQGKLTGQFPAWHWQDLGQVNLSTAPPWLAEKARNLPIGKPSDAMALSSGALIIFVCSRNAGDGKVDREAIGNQIGTEKLELQARGLLRDLRREAYLDVRLGKGS